MALAIALLLALPAHPASAFKIVHPAEGAVLHSGQTVTIKVDLGRDPGIVKVRYYWYPEQAETLVQQDDEVPGSRGSATVSGTPDGLKDSVSGAPVVAIAALVATADREPPFGGAITVPKDAVGVMRLLAVADISRGRLGTRTVFDEILVKVEPAAALTHLDFETDKPLVLGRAGQIPSFGQIDSLGKVFELPVVGEFADGVLRPLSTPSAGTSYASSNEQVIKALHDGLLQIVGNGKATVTVKNRGQQASLDIAVDVGNEPNLPPIADAGPNRTVKSGAKVELNGLKSTDPEGEALYYTWSQVRGSKIPLLDVNMPKASFVAPLVSEPKLYRFKLRVTDKQGADSVPAYVDVVVEP